MQAELQIEKIEKSFFGVKVLKGVSLVLQRGHTLGLVGENGAGKSTLMNLLGGNLQPDNGRMMLGGETYNPRSPRDAERCRIAFVHQELNLFPNLSIAENIFLTTFPRTGGVINKGAIQKQTAALLAKVGLEVAPETLVEQLSAGERQLVEVAKTLSLNPRVVILDEPTTSLSARETERLFALMEKLRKQEVSIIYISHALGDVLRLCDDIVVLRDGEVVAAGARSEFTLDRMVTLMVGRDIQQMFPPREAEMQGDAVLEVRGASQPNIVKDISFTLRRGEVLGISGLMGSGRTELARILFGLDPMQVGEIFVEGKPVHNLSPQKRIRSGMAFLTESRREEGLCMEASISENMTLACAPAHARGLLGWLDREALHGLVKAIRESIKLTSTAQAEQPVKTLSGGNQQKVVLGKWLLNKPRVFILDEPTRGIDVGAKYEVYKLINELAASGAGLLVISSEIEELIGICDRILVMGQGEIRDEILREEFDRERILRGSLRAGKTTQ